MIRLKPLQAGGPFVLEIKGQNTVDWNAVYVGEVWLCSGQSNMDFTVAATPRYDFAGVQNEPAEQAAANYPQLRMFSGEWQRAYTPQTSVDGVWKICTPHNVRQFSAIGYFFGRDLQQALHVPVGIITMTYGASTAEAWVRREALEQIPEMKDRLAQFDAAAKAFPEDLRRKNDAAY